MVISMQLYKFVEYIVVWLESTIKVNNVSTTLLYKFDK